MTKLPPPCASAAHTHTHTHQIQFLLSFFFFSSLLLFFSFLPLSTPNPEKQTNKPRNNEENTQIMTLKTLPVIFQQQQQQQQQSSSSSPFLLLSPFSWLFLNRRRRIFFLTICSPVLLPLLCLSFPFICLSHLYLCICLRQRRRRRDDGCLRRCEEGRGERIEEEDEEEREMGWMLLQRYLEDQLGLVGSVVSVYDCGADDDDFDDHQQQIHDDSRRPFLI